jgi:hypothetical protein
MSSSTVEREADITWPDVYEEVFVVHSDGVLAV